MVNSIDHKIFQMGQNHGLAPPGVNASTPSAIVNMIIIKNGVYLFSITKLRLFRSMASFSLHQKKAGEEAPWPVY